MFFNRQQETEQLFNFFKHDKNVLMLAPRRVGKTELMHRIAGLAEERGFRAILFDMEGYCEEKDFFQELCSAIQPSFRTPYPELAYTAT
jgi:AAA+ ATPase superfamily predicted ATPase